MFKFIAKNKYLHKHFKIKIKSEKKIKLPIGNSLTTPTVLMLEALQHVSTCQGDRLDVSRKSDLTFFDPWVKYSKYFMRTVHRVSGAKCVTQRLSLGSWEDAERSAGVLKTAFSCSFHKK